MCAVTSESRINFRHARTVTSGIHGTIAGHAVVPCSSGGYGGVMLVSQFIRYPEVPLNPVTAQRVLIP